MKHTEAGTPAKRVTRRGFLQATAAATALAAVPAGARANSTPQESFLDLLRPPDSATAYVQGGVPLRLTRAGAEWQGGGVLIETLAAASGLALTLSAPHIAVERVHLRWRAAVALDLLVLGDAWERSYGDLGWRNLIPERVMPWYFATLDGELCHGYGIKTQAGALCFWQLDAEGVSLWLDTTNGGAGVMLAGRTLAAATVVTRRGLTGEDPHAAMRAFCQHLCAEPWGKLAHGPLYGFNDWYYAYGRSTAQTILADTDFLAQLTGGNAVRPFSVIDGGWEENPAFPDMPGLAGEIKRRAVRPGAWIRPLLAKQGANKRLLLPDARFGPRRERARELAYDPTLPEARELVVAKVTQVVGWGYELVKHDFSTYDLLGQWGFEMGAGPTLPGWSLHDRSRTNAEVIGELYRAIREACAPGTILIGCNTVGHLGQGIFDAQRTGDDTSGRDWERTRRMGVNTLAFRLPQHQTFFLQDADCVGITAEIAWEKNRAWMDVLARTGTTLFVSPGEGSRDPEQAGAIRAAFSLAASLQGPAGAGVQPVSWTRQSAPELWATAPGDEPLHYDWSGPDGAWPFPV